MAQMTKEQWHRFAAQWKETGTALDDIRRKELEKMTYQASDADILLDLGSRFAQPRKTSGLVIMQRYFMKWRKQQEKKLK